MTTAIRIPSIGQKITFHNVGSSVNPSYAGTTGIVKRIEKSYVYIKVTHCPTHDLSSEMMFVVDAQHWGYKIVNDDWDE